MNQRRLVEMSYPNYVMERTKPDAYKVLAVPVIGWLVGILWFGFVAPLGYLIEENHGVKK